MCVGVHGLYLGTKTSKRCAKQLQKLSWWKTFFILAVISTVLMKSFKIISCEPTADKPALDS